jgi:hypothetical protein
LVSGTVQQLVTDCYVRSSCSNTNNNQSKKTETKTDLKKRGGNKNQIEKGKETIKYETQKR